MKSIIVNPKKLYDPSPNGYSHAVVVEGGSRVAYISGQGGEDKNGLLSTLFADQVKQAYINLTYVLDELGAQPNQVTKITTYVVNYDPSLLDEMTRQLLVVFGNHLPAQTLVPVHCLALKGMLFEVEAIVIFD